MFVILWSQARKTIFQQLVKDGLGYIYKDVRKLEYVLLFSMVVSTDKYINNSVS